MRITLFGPDGPVINHELVADMLDLIEAPHPDIEKWSENELRVVYDWAAREYLAASDHKGMRVPSEPWLVRKHRAAEVP